MLILSYLFCFTLQEARQDAPKPNVQSGSYCIIPSINSPCGPTIRYSGIQILVSNDLTSTSTGLCLQQNQCLKRHEFTISTISFASLSEDCLLALVGDQDGVSDVFASAEWE